MAENYPLVEQREYGRAGRRAGFLGRRVTRADDELPRLAAHHVRVFRVGVEYVEDQGQLRPDHPTVVEAASVTVVDRRVEVPVVVETRIPSAEAGDFTVRTTFYCTVTDPCTVVRDGITDVEALLLGHLRSVPGLVEDGSDRSIVDSLAVRDRIDARLTAYHEMRPTTLSGLRARHGIVEVFSPAELADALAQEDDERRQLEWKREREEREQEAALRRALLETELELRREELRNTSALQQERHRQEEERQRSRFERATDIEQQRHELGQQDVRETFTRGQLEKDFQLIGADPSAADFLAWRNGDITSDELAQRLDRRRQTDREAELERMSVDRDDERWKLERDDRREELTRAEDRADAADQRREDAHRWELDHEDGLRRRQEERADTERLQRDERVWANDVLTVKADLSRRAIDRGLFDSTIRDAGQFINGVGDVPYKQRADGREVVEGDTQGELEGASEPAETGERTGRDDDRDIDYDDNADLDFGGTDSEASLGH
ncbi:hypothetical protein OG223_28290 [Streptomyces sp. NBC_01478]|uniref:hypothetical protein n=1 Tax=Streptomyces sp. NBC_01478 TaxID=2903882 RepID=UPI002E34B88B|nr:hypothetical protein [Streptomyces sp. NBC_01478]